MKKLSIILVILMVFACTTAWASGMASNSDTQTRLSLIYGGEIDSKIAFYQKRLFLINSESKILSDIGKDAANRVAFLKNNRQKLINEMLAKDITLSTPKMSAFLGKTMSGTNLTTMEAYSE